MYASKQGIRRSTLYTCTLAASNIHLTGMNLPHDWLIHAVAACEGLGFRAIENIRPLDYDVDPSLSAPLQCKATIGFSVGKHRVKAHMFLFDALFVSGCASAFDCMSYFMYLYGVIG